MESGMQKWEEEELVTAATGGDPRAYDALVRHYRPAAVSLARQIVRCKEKADDVAQDALITAFKALPQLREPSRFGPWLASIVRHRAFRSKEPASVSLDEVLLRYIPSLALPTQEMAEDVVLAINALPEELRPTTELYFLEEWSAPEIADFLDLPLTTVKWRLHTARKQLSPRLARTLENMK
jgi:RNA polymerase sigma-70 factor (ECF subfamily)